VWRPAASSVRYQPRCRSRATRALDSPRRQIAARHADPRTTTIYDRRLQNFDRHAAYVVVVAFVAGG